jgi:ubiquinone/menaquinone biosynthesis C-methylase UbiE
LVVNNSIQEQPIKQKIKERYSKIALTGTETCCAPTIDFKNNAFGSSCCSPTDSATVFGYESKELESIPQASILGVGCGAPLHHAAAKEGETVVDLGSGAEIDVLLSANRVGESGRIIGIDLTDEILEKARRNAKENGYTNVEFRKGDIEKRIIPVDDNSVDLVISNCVINLTMNKVDTFKEVHRILKPGQGRMIISDLVTDKEVHKSSVDSEKWCNCIDGALTKENYLDSIRKAGFENPEILEEKLYIQEECDDRVDDNKRKISSIVVKAVKKTS